MYSPIVVTKGRTTVLLVNVGEDVSGDTFTSEIREEAEQTSDHIATWVVTFETDGTDGMLKLTYDDNNPSQISKTTGYMDVKRESGGKLYSLFDEPLQVTFKETVTV